MATTAAAYQNMGALHYCEYSLVQEARGGGGAQAPSFFFHLGGTFYIAIIALDLLI